MTLEWGLGRAFFADAIISGGPIYTGSDTRPRAESIAIRDGRVIAAGTTSELSPLVGPKSEQIDLQGRTLIPGLIDAHVHLSSFAISLDRVDLAGAASLDEAVRRVAEFARRKKPGEWILGSGWNRNIWGVMPTRRDLDTETPDNPVILASKDMHAQWANSKALAIIGITKETIDPQGGKIVRDEISGEPTGLLLENVGWTVGEASQLPEPALLDALIAKALSRAAEVGITGLHVPEGKVTIASLRRLRARGRLPIRVLCHFSRAMLDHALEVGVGTGFGDDYLRLGNLKLFLDGALGSQTALMIEPFTGTDDRGIGILSPDEFIDLVERAARGGIATTVHAIGDAATRIAIDGYEKTEAIWRPLGLRQRIEHVQLIHPDDIPRLGRIGVICSMQPTHATSDWEMAERYWAGRTQYSYAWRTLALAGGKLAFGSDCPVERIEPLLGLYAAMTRMTPAGSPTGGWRPQERLSAEEALHAFTLGPAYAAGEEATKGSLEAGKYADFTVLADDPFAGKPELCLTTRVEATYVEGKPVFGRLD